MNPGFSSPVYNGSSGAAGAFRLLLNRAFGKLLRQTEADCGKPEASAGLAGGMKNG